MSKIYARKNSVVERSIPGQPGKTYLSAEKPADIERNRKLQEQRVQDAQAAKEEARRLAESALRIASYQNATKVNYFEEKAKAEANKETVQQNKDILSNPKKYLNKWDAEKQNAKYQPGRDAIGAMTDEQRQALENANALNPGKVPEWVSKAYGDEQGKNIMGAYSNMKKEEEAVEVARKLQEEQEKNRAVMEEQMTKVEAMTPEERKALEFYNQMLGKQAFSGAPELYQGAMGDAMSALNGYSNEEIAKMAEALRWSDSAERMEEVKENAREFGHEHPVIGSIGAIGSNLIGAVTGPFGYLGEMANQTGQFSTLNPNNMGTAFQQQGAQLQGAVKKDIIGDGNSGIRRGLGYLYQGGMSLADSAARIAAAGPAGSLALAGMGSFAQTMQEASEKGATPAQATIMAAASAGLEVATEKIPLDDWLDIAKGGAQPVTDALLSAFKQAGVEATTEEISLIGGMIVEAAVMKEKSGYNQDIADMVAGGMSYDEAKATKQDDIWREVLDTAIVSGLSGAMSSAGGSIIAGVDEKVQDNRGLESYIAEDAARKAAEADAAKAALEARDSAARQYYDQHPEEMITQEAIERIRGQETTQDTQAPGGLTQADIDQLGAQWANQEVTKEIPPMQPMTNEQIQAAADQVLGVDTGVTQGYNNINQNTEGAIQNGAEGLQQNDGAGSFGNSPEGMAGVQQSNRPDDQGRGEPGGLAEHSGILRVSDGLQQAQQKRGTPTYPVQDTTVNPEGYEQALTAGRNSDTKNGWCVTPKSAQELREENIRTFMNESGTVGVGVAPDGDIVAVFKNKNGGPKKALDTMMPIAIEQGGNKLDCYGEGLVKVYSQYGFEPVARVVFNPEYANEGWTPGMDTPYIYMMKHNGDSADTVVSQMGNYDVPSMEQLSDLPTFGKNDYDKAMAYRDSLMKGRESTPQVDTKNVSMGEGQDSGPVGSGTPIDFHYMNVAPQNSYFTNSEKGGYVLYDNGSVYPGEKLMNGYNDMQGWRYSGVSTVFDLVANGAAVDPKNSPNGYYRVAEVARPARIKTGAGGSYYVAEKGVLQLTDDTTRETKTYGTETMNGGQEGDRNLSAAEADFTGKGDYYDLLTDENTQRDRPGDVRPVEVPKTDANGRKISESVGNIYGSALTSDAMANRIEEIAAEGALGYDKVSNKAQLEKAYAEIWGSDGKPGAGAESAKADIYRNVGKRKPKQGDIAKAMLLYDYYNQQSGAAALDSATEIFVDLQQMATRAGRDLQLFSLFNKLTPDGKLKTVEKTAQRALDRMKAHGRVKADAEITISEDLKSEYLSIQKELDKARKGTETDSGDGGKQYSEEDIAKAEKQVSEAQAKLDKANEAKRKAEAEVNEAQERVERVRDERNRMEKDTKRANSYVETAPDKIEKAYNKANEIEASFPEYQAKLDEANEAKRKAEAEVNAAKAELKKQQDRLKEVKRLTKSAENYTEKSPDKIKDLEEKAKQTEQAIYAQAASQMPATIKEKTDTLRYMAMLGNVKTNLRNIAGNLVFRPFVDTKRAVGAAVERMVLPQDQRTKAIMNVFDEGDRALMKWAVEDSKTQDVNDALKYTAKFGDDATAMRVVEENKRVFESDVMEKIRKVTEFLPAEGDMLFKNWEYQASVASFMKARGITAQDIQNGNVSESVLNEGRQYAINEAMKATFNDSNALSDFVATRYTGDNIVGKVLDTMASGVMPFRRTPANIIARTVEYSPVGLLKGAYDMGASVEFGEMTAATAIDEMAAGLTGSVAMTLGFFLAKLGVLKGRQDDEDEERRGIQAYSIVTKNGSYTINWAAPANMPLFIGANLFQNFADAGADTDMNKFVAVLNAFGAGLDPIISLSCMSSVNDLLESIKYAREGEPLYTIAASAATSYINQFMPSILRQTSNVFMQENKRRTFAQNDDPTIRGIERTAAQIPFVGDSLKTDYINEWGEKVSNGSFIERALNQFVNPGTYRKRDNSQLEEEIERLNKSLPESVSPRDIPAAITYTDADGNKHEDHRLTKQEDETLRTVTGQMQKEMLDTLINSDAYKSLSDAEKAKVYDYVYDYAREKGREAALDGYEISEGWMNDIPEGEEQNAILSKVTGSVFTDAFDALTKDWDYGRDTAGSVADLERAYTVYDGMDEDVKDAFRENNGGRVDYFLTAKENGVETGTFLDLYKQYKDLYNNKDLSTGDKANDWATVLAKAQKEGAISREAEAALKDSMGFRYSMEAKTEHLDELNSMGLSPDTSRFIVDTINNLTGTGGVDKQSGEKRVTNEDKYRMIASLNGKNGLTTADIDKVMKEWMTDYDPTAKSPDKIELKYDYARKDMGLSPSQFAWAKTDYSKYSTKEDRERAWKNHGIPESKFKELHKLLGGSDKKFNARLVELYG